MIKEYRFGSITVDGKIYDYDVEVRWTGDVAEWFRRDAHLIDVEDVVAAVEQRPEFIAIGTGESGAACLTEEAKAKIEAEGIEIFIDVTEKAIGAFNAVIEQGMGKKAIGLFHLTC